MGCWRLSTTTNLFHLLTCDGFTVAVHRSLCHNDDVQTGATGSLLSERAIKHEIIFFTIYDPFFLYYKVITSDSLLHRCSSQTSSGGISGMKTQSAPHARAVTKARYLPVKSHTGVHLSSSLIIHLQLAVLTHSACPLPPE